MKTQWNKGSQSILYYSLCCFMSFAPSWFNPLFYQDKKAHEENIFVSLFYFVSYGSKP